jgi:hypothetical protein
MTLFIYQGWAQSVADINIPTLTGVDQITPFYEGLAAVRRGNTWGFIDDNGKLVIDFRADLFGNSKIVVGNFGDSGISYPRFRNGRCPIRVFKSEDPGIPFYGFIDKKGKTVIEPEFLNVSEFKDGIALGIYYKKTFRGKNTFQLNIYDYSFTEVVLNPAGEMIWPLAERHHISMDRRRYKTPDLLGHILSGTLIGIGTESNPGLMEIRKINP